MCRNSYILRIAQHWELKINLKTEFWKISEVDFVDFSAGLFTVAGLAQMSIWAKDKHRKYKKEFKNYPNRKAIIPLFL